MNKIYSITINDNEYLVKLIDRRMKSIRMRYIENTIIISGNHLNMAIANDFINLKAIYHRKIIDRSNINNSIGNNISINHSSNYFNITFQYSRLLISFLYNLSYKL